jgi:hypothetical protein
MHDRSNDIAKDEDRGRASQYRDGGEAEAFRALAGGGPIEDAGLLSEIKARIRRSLDDPRPSLTLGEVDDFIDVLASKARAEVGRA